MPTSDIMNLLHIVEAQFIPDFGQEMAGQGSGRILVNNHRPMLWRARLTSENVPHENMAEITALYAAMGGSMGTFYVWNPAPSGQGPRLDPTGATLGAATVQLKSINADTLHLSLKGLPAAYTLKRGDALAFDYDSPARRAYHVVVDATVTADGSGETAEFEVAPAIQPGAAIDDEVFLIQPAAEMQFRPGTFDPSLVNIGGRLTIEAAQVI